MSKTHDLLNKQVANYTVLYTKLHQHHWYVTGPHFIPLHKKFEELYDGVAEKLDEIAERLLSIGGKPVATLQGSLELSVIGEATESLSAEEMIRSVIADFTLLVDQWRELTDAAQAEQDESTADLAIGTITELQKELWILSSLIS